MTSFAADPAPLHGRTALVTGASGGLGRHFAGVLGAAGARVIVAARRAERVAALVEDLRSCGISARPVELDVTSADSVRSAFDAVSDWDPPDVIVSNAGVTVTRALLEQTEADWDHVLDTNLKGGWLVTTEAARRLVTAGRGGSIVHTASILGERVAGGVAPYAISKAALVQATRVMALELARHRIRVNALLPGYVVTDLNREFLESPAGQRLRDRIPARRFVQPSELDGALLLLAGDAGAAITGVALPVDNGHLVSGL